MHARAGLKIIEPPRSSPQGLKPRFILARIGTAKAVPFPKPSVKPFSQLIRLNGELTTACAGPPQPRAARRGRADLIPGQIENPESLPSAARSVRRSRTTRLF